jgi:hypothetical protein
MGGLSIGRRPAPVTTRGFSAPALDAGDLARALLDLKLPEVVEALRENATPAQAQMIGEAFGRPQQTAPQPRPALQEALANRTILEIRDAITGTLTADALPSLLAVLADEVPAERLGPLAHRLAVRTKNTGDLIDPEPIAATTLASVKALIGEHLTTSEIRSLEFELAQIRKEVGARERAAQKAAV